MADKNKSENRKGSSRMSQSRKERLARMTGKSGSDPVNEIRAFVDHLDREKKTAEEKITEIEKEIKDRSGHLEKLRNPTVRDSWLIDNFLGENLVFDEGDPKIELLSQVVFGKTPKDNVNESALKFAITKIEDELSKKRMDLLSARDELNKLEQRRSENLSLLAKVEGKANPDEQESVFPENTSEECEAQRLELLQTIQERITGLFTNDLANSWKALEVEHKKTNQKYIDLMTRDGLGWSDPRVRTVGQKIDEINRRMAEIFAQNQQRHAELLKEQGNVSYLDCKGIQAALARHKTQDANKGTTRDSSQGDKTGSGPSLSKARKDRMKRLGG